MNRVPKPIVLIILDGWGINPRKKANAIALAQPFFYQTLLKDYPSTRLLTSGPAVGLPKGQMGNSEVGHQNLGAGRIIYQDFARINQAIEDDSFMKNPAFLHLIGQVKQRDAALHLLGLVSDGGVHSHIRHLFRLLDLAKRHGLRGIFVHAFLDGRDTPPESGINYLMQLSRYLKKIRLGTIATVSGRYYAMDRDQRWPRIQKAYDAIVHGHGERYRSPLEAVKESYRGGVTDEFLVPCVIIDERQQPIGRISDQDGVIFFNFRADRAREMTRALTMSSFDKFDRGKAPRLSGFVSMTRYEEGLDLPAAFEPQSTKHLLGQIVSELGMRQLRIAETEKYAHVTYFFNGGEEKVFHGEERILIPSPRDVTTYDQKPEMSAYQVTEEVVKRINQKGFDLIVLNYANPDMVGHTGVLSAAVKAVQVIDVCLRQVVGAVQRQGGAVLLTADHGNLEQMVDYKTGQPYTAHTTNPVPFILIGDYHGRLRSHGALQDVAPTILDLIAVQLPREMTGRSLLVRNRK